MSSRFDDWSEVKDCNGCEHYYTSACSGVPVNQQRNCQSFKATRFTDIPARMKRIEDDYRRIKHCFIFLTIYLSILLVCIGVWMFE